MKSSGKTPGQRADRVMLAVSRAFYDAQISRRVVNNGTVIGGREADTPVQG